MKTTCVSKCAVLSCFGRETARRARRRTAERTGMKLIEKVASYLKRIGPRRIIGSFAGNLLIAVGVSLFKCTLLGNDPSSAAAMAVADRLGVSFALCLFCMQFLCFVVEFFRGRKYIGIGTFVNWFCIGSVVDLLLIPFGRIFPSDAPFFVRVLVMLLGVAVASLGVSLYQTSDSGVSPYDSLSMCLADHTPVPYFWCRIFTDGVCTLIAWLCGGIVGLGTLICAVGLGPVISFFNRTVSERVLRTR